METNLTFSSVCLIMGEEILLVLWRDANDLCHVTEGKNKEQKVQKGKRVNKFKSIGLIKVWNLNEWNIISLWKIFVN